MAEKLSFSSKAGAPFTTHAMSDLGATARDYAASCPGATFVGGLAVQGERVDQANSAINAWLQHIDLAAS
ncbi:hypothetical protein [Streptomyces sp. NPDC002088]|uniref:hypothetical protein n=1 Tax=Streptomyces sp. NPDC002088 TaxID=3154665 RepID=UPI00332642C9